MKKVFIYSTIALSLLCANNVNACGELKSLKVENATIKANGQTGFLVTLKNNVNEVMLDATSDYDFVEGYGPRVVDTSKPAVLKVNGNACGYGIYTYTVDFKVPTNLIAEADNTSTATYTAQLQNITIENVNLDFKPNVYEYSIEVPQETEYLNFSTTKINETDSVIISSNSFALKEGLNKVTVTVHTKESDTAIYTFNVTRKAVASDNNYLASLTISGYSNLNFDRSVTNYTLTIDSKDTILNLKAVAEDKKAKVEELGNNNLKNGSLVTIKVTAENGEERNYTITIKKTFNIMDYWMYLLIAGLILILALLLFLSKNKKNKKKEDKVGPDVVETPQQTAGEVFTPEVKTPEVEAQTITEGNATLEVITPTDIEIVPEEASQQEAPTQEPNFEEMYEQHANTEIFKL